MSKIVTYWKSHMGNGFKQEHRRILTKFYLEYNKGKEIDLVKYAGLGEGANLYAGEYSNKVFKNTGVFSLLVVATVLAVIYSAPAYVHGLIFILIGYTLWRMFFNAHGATFAAYMGREIDDDVRLGAPKLKAIRDELEALNDL